MNFVKSGNYFKNYSHRIGDMGYIESDNPNSAYMASSYCTGQSYPSQMRSG